MESSSNNAQETARLLNPEMIVPPPASTPPRAASGAVCHVGKPPSFELPTELSVLIAFRIVTACLALTCFVLIMNEGPRWWSHNGGYLPAMIVSIISLLWQSIVLYFTVRKPSCNCNNVPRGKEATLLRHVFLGFVDLGICSGLLVSWILILKDWHEHGISGVSGAVLFLEAFVVVFQTVPSLRNLVVTSREEEALYQIGLPPSERPGSLN